MNLAGGRKSKPGAKGKQAKQSAAGGGSCSVPYNRNSFTGDTPVLLADGTRKPIASITVGDVVQATDPTTDTSGPREVTDVRSHESERLLYEITVTTDTGNGTLTATDEHPFWVDNLNTWVNAEDLKPGYTFTTADNRPATVAGTRPFADARLVYNLTVDGLHTYYVGSAGGGRAADVLVHNCGDDDIDHVALGMSPRDRSEPIRVQNFAKQVGARHLMNETDWKEQVATAVERVADGTGKISFMLDHMTGRNSGSAGALAAAKNSYDANDVDWTQWELLQIANAGLMDKVDFYRYNRKHKEWRRVE
jgi:hypothetical protein